MTHPMIFNLQRFSLHDGDGIRTLIFFKGCPLRCLWCSNPEGQAFGQEILFEPRKCIACGECVQQSQQGEFRLEQGKIVMQRGQITHPEEFKDLCPTRALTVVGADKTVSEMMAEISKDLPFYQNSEGGVTISGGEPFAQPELLRELLQTLKLAGIQTAIETCLHVPWKAIAPSAGLINMFLADLKHADPDIFRQFTGGNLNLILANLKHLEEEHAQVIMRIPVIPGFNHTAEDIQRILDIVTTLRNIQAVHFIPYHPLGSQKYELSGRTYTFPLSVISDAEVQPYLSYAHMRGLHATIGG